jgi:predicted nucleic acid-binding protein
MQSVVVDSNIVFSLLLSKNTQLKNPVFDPDVYLYAPNYLFIEIFRLKEKKYPILKAKQ